MSEILLPRPTVTVATVVERDGRFLLVEEETRWGRKLNQPAGHLEPGESLAAAAMRETLEETAWSVLPTALVGVYRWEAADNGATFVRFTFCAQARGHDPHRTLDVGIVGAVWLAYEEIAGRRGDHRSPLVQRCLDDYRAGVRWPLEVVTEVAVQRELGDTR
jgi:ADP-ribose pyrophosphatase YjhB (NUDIX family)